jgi:hypothetical protein
VALKRHGNRTSRDCPLKHHDDDGKGSVTEVLAKSKCWEQSWASWNSMKMHEVASMNLDGHGMKLHQQLQVG